jgi:hypothetical protein
VTPAVIISISKVTVVVAAIHLRCRDIRSSLEETVSWPESLEQPMDS